MSLNSEDKKYLINLLESGEQIPEDYKYLLFPNLQEEYELTYAGKMRREDILAGEDGTLPVPLQLERVFNGKEHPAFEDGWKNMIVFGDNLQFLKTINENKDPLIKDKVKGKVKLIYIDPPFATQDEFQNKEGAKAYSDKKKGSEFLEFIRRRLILAKEILSDDGSIYVHMDQKMGHYVKLILDEVFGKNCYQNEIVWHYRTGNLTYSHFQQKHDSIFFYGKKTKPYFEQQYIKEYYVQIYGPDKKLSMKGPNDGIDKYGEYKISQMDDVWNISAVFTLSKEHISYPTQKPEELLARIIKASTNEGDIIMDFFGGSGTSMSVAEKLGRRWITCDLGKLSYLTMQKRLLQIQDSKCLESKTKYDKPARSFITCKLGMYDLRTTLNLEWDKYKHFVSQLFEYDAKEVKTSGIQFDGEKRGFPVKVFNYIEHKESAVDYNYISELHKSIKSKKYSRVYIVAPATRVDFIADYEELDDTRYYFLKVPYEMIEELHKTPFTKSRQPRSKDDVNDIEEMKGFQFIYTPEVECVFKNGKKDTVLSVTKFVSDPLNGCEMDNFSTLSSIFVNYDYNGKEFLMDDVRFWSEIESDKKENKDTKVNYDNEKPTSIEWKIPTKLLGNKTVFIFTDIYGNDVTVSLSKEK
ncbi:DNA methyltransferase [Streptococcus equi]|uniref:DNA methyltransferase n=1 Tax=Streptococcus equi TaxID=1336 RepID=UPI0024AD8F44|nr:site-specific DNA-methyltransferase [Streptococcus equi]MDI5916181.1 site-specific DNA-methyltransferase [Streptococcus equi subsp. zooepidemicus]HEL1259081.1 site-specific DNA-methyltransferase [Streptococcus equi subsp. zooepidemicus]